jgi:low affinity Fe/Cu permease
MAAKIAGWAGAQLSEAKLMGGLAREPEIEPVCFQVMALKHVFTRFANTISRLAGRPVTFILCLTLVIVWALSGPMFGFSDTWQLIINTSTTIITFLMVFLIQNTQNRDNAALQAKLDELIRVSEGQNRFIGIEHLTDEDLEEILHECEEYADDLRDARHTRKKAPHEPAGERDGKTRKPRVRKKTSAAS